MKLSKVAKPMLSFAMAFVLTWSAIALTAIPTWPSCSDPSYGPAGDCHNTPEKCTEECVAMCVQYRLPPSGTATDYNTCQDCCGRYNGGNPTPKPHCLGAGTSQPTNPN